ncbi:hypothetical protein QBC46DRAFT_442190 [Diplogelasinospora grovesii]|uniref:GMC oxidoreductase n=1 Tax=Diplogelasinospora grovesii TaxID=303347 RepID=A0AAN6NFY2_9PEZI|nr:hypothetical protein QBC46DRAFT_442190 [Diplogelasinospora grovesii]
MKLYFPTIAAILAPDALADSSKQRSQRRLFSSAFGYPGVNASYDYVVIGGGTAGLTLASRLAAHASVAVIEAGTFAETTNGNNSVVPLLSLTGIGFIDATASFTPQPLMDWSLLSQPIAGAAGRQIHYAQGKALGGSSTINTMSYIRSTKSAYARWAEIAGDTSYNWDAMLPFLRRSVHLTPPNQAQRNNTNVTVGIDNSVFDAAGGPLEVSWNNWVDPTLTWLAKAVEQGAGLPVSTTGFASGTLAGHGAWAPGTIDPERATRSDSETSFLRAAIKDTSLVVYPLTQATNILFDGSSPPKAVGVKVSSLGAEYTVAATKEVVLSAGVFHSPQLLMVSGVGPPATLRSLSIPVVSALPGVGQNLQDPIQIFAAYPLTTPSGQTLTAHPALRPTYLKQYLENGGGPYSSAAGFLAFERIPFSYRARLSNATQAKLAAFANDWPEVAYVAGSFVGPNLTTVGTMAAFLPLAFSRGNVSISSASMEKPPIIDLDWFSDPADMELALTALKRLRNDIWQSAAANGVKAGPELLPGAAMETDAQLEDFVRTQALTIWHASGTCAMGQAAGAATGKAVVDSAGRVFGVAGLRVCDASVFPFVLPGYPQAGVYALAEKMADALLKGA